MTSPINSIGSIMSSFPTSGVGADMSVGTTTSTAATPGAGTDFASVLATSLDGLQATQSKADGLALQAASGDLKDVHDYMIASNEASLATQMVVTIKNKAVDAFNEIMRMPV